MYSAKDTEESKLELFNQNEKWQKVIEEFLGAWTKFFDYETGHKGIDNPLTKLLAKADGLLVHSKTKAGLCVRFRTKFTGHWGHRSGQCRIDYDAFTELNIYNVTVRPIWFGLRERYVEIKTLGLYHKTEAPSRGTLKQYWLDSPELWKVESVNFDHLPDILAAIKLLRERTIDAEDACEAHKDRMEIFNDYLDGLAEVL